jgi:hypothetical protein
VNCALTLFGKARALISQFQKTMDKLPHAKQWIPEAKQRERIHNRRCKSEMSEFSKKEMKEISQKLANSFTMSIYYDRDSVTNETQKALKKKGFGVYPCGFDGVNIRPRLKYRIRSLFRPTTRLNPTEEPQ